MCAADVAAPSVEKQLSGCCDITLWIRRPECSHASYGHTVAYRLSYCTAVSDTGSLSLAVSWVTDEYFVLDLSNISMYCFHCELFDSLTSCWTSWRLLIGFHAPCGLRGCKNWPAAFPGRMSYKVTKPGLVSVLLYCYLLEPLFMYC